MPNPKTHWLRRLTKVALAAVVSGYLAICLLITVFQRHLTFVPRRLPLNTAKATANAYGLLPWVNATGEIIGWRPAPHTPHLGSVLIVHGNGGSALDLVWLTSSIHDSTGLDAYLLEYPGYGHRGGSPSESTLLAAADDAWALLPTNIPGYVVSESLGTGVAAHLAQKYPTQVAGLLLFVPYDRLASVAQNHYPFLPAYFLLLDRFDPIDWLAGYHGPVKIVIAGQDEIIPPERGENLYESYHGPKSLQIVPNSGHGGTDKQSAQWWRDVLRFWQSSKTQN